MIISTICGISLAIFPLLVLSAPAGDWGHAIRIPLTKRHMLNGTASSPLSSSSQNSYGRRAGHCTSNDSSTDCDYLSAGSSAFSSTSHDARHEKFTKRAKTSLVPATTLNDALWQAQVDVGGQSLDALIDTGSSDMVFFGSECQPAKTLGKKIYSPKKKQSISGQVVLPYGGGSGSITGKTYIDTVKIGGFTAKKQAIIAADTMTGQFLQNTFSADGILGLGFPAASQAKQTPLLYTLVKDKQLSALLFAILLRTGEGCYSELSLGAPNEQLYKGPVTYVPVIEMLLWKIVMDKMSVNGKQVVGPSHAILDSGVTFIVGSHGSVANFYTSIPGSKLNPTGKTPGFWTIPCRNAPNIRVSLTFGRRSFDIPPQDFSWEENGLCYAAILEHPGFGVNDPWIIGDIFFNQAYIIFNGDPQSPRIGLATVSDRVAAC